jgi:hypothetical protein
MAAIAQPQFSPDCQLGGHNFIGGDVLVGAATAIARDGVAGRAARLVADLGGRVER